MDVYLPAEDSELIAQCVYERVKGRVLEVGCGSGFVAKCASLVAQEVVAVDINPDAIEYAKKNHDARNISWVESDMFESVVGEFDWIYTNPPYLPTEPRAPDIALDGGPEGWEWIARFLMRVASHLKPKGKILLLFSTLSKEEKVQELIAQNNFTYTEVGSQKLFGETLYVYELTLCD